jgi:hypothetical protein
MNPYFEQPGVWPHFHSAMLNEFVMQMSSALPPGYYATQEVMLFIHEPPAARRLLGRADDAVAIGGPAGTGGDTSAGLAVTEPQAVMDVGEPIDIEKHRYVEIRTTSGKRLVTVIELLSPSNKVGGDREVYLSKRNELVLAGVNVLQIDLLRGGPQLLPTPTDQPRYNAMLIRGNGWQRADVWLWSLPEALPVLPVPLLEPDKAVAIPLRATLDAVHDKHGFAGWLYSDPPQPPLTVGDAAWAAEVLAGIER